MWSNLAGWPGRLRSQRFRVSGGACLPGALGAPGTSGRLARRNPRRKSLKCIGFAYTCSNSTKSAPIQDFGGGPIFWPKTRGFTNIFLQELSITLYKPLASPAASGLRPRLRRPCLVIFACFGLLFSARSAERTKMHDFQRFWPQNTAQAKDPTPGPGPKTRPRTKDPGPGPRAQDKDQDQAGEGP